MKKKLFIVALILVFVTIAFGTLNYFMVSQAKQENTTQFENKISELEKRMKDEKKESKISSIKGFKELEKEIDVFDKKIMLVTINKESFKPQSQKVKDKIKEATENLNALYKSKLDANIKNQNTLSKEELGVMITNLDSLVKEIHDDKILTEEEIKPFEDRVNEVKTIYANEVTEKKVQESAAAPNNQNSGNNGNGQTGNGENAGSDPTQSNSDSDGYTEIWDVDADGNKIPGTTIRVDNSTGAVTKVDSSEE